MYTAFNSYKQVTKYMPGRQVCCIYIYIYVYIYIYKGVVCHTRFLCNRHYMIDISYRITDLGSLAK